MREKIIIILLLSAVGVGNIYKFSFFSPDIHVSFLDGTILLLTAYSLAVNRALLFAKLRDFSSLTRPALIFISIAVLSLIPAFFRFGTLPALVGSLYLVRWLVYSLFFASIICLIKQQAITKTLLLIGLVITAISWGQYLLVPDIRFLQALEWDPHYYRVVGTFLDPGFTGLMLVFTLTYLTLHPIKNRLIHLTVWSASYSAFALTYSRSSYLAFLASMAYISWKRHSWKLFLGIILLFTATIFLLPRAPDGEGVKLERTTSIQARMDSWKTAWQIFSQRPILGSGFNTYRYAQGASLKSHAGAGSDSSLLFISATTGLAGLLAYLWYLTSLYKLQAKSYLLKATLVAALVHSLFLNSLFYPAVLVWIALLIAHAGSLDQLD